MSTLGKHLFKIPRPYYILGDAAYKVFDRVLVPFEGKGRTEVEKNFNFFQSSIRMNIECSFGLMVARWGGMWRPLHSTMERNILTIRAVVVLHNWCQHHQAIPITAPGGGRRGVGLEERPFINQAGAPVEMLAGDAGPANARTEPAMSAQRRVLAAEIE